MGILSAIRKRFSSDPKREQLIASIRQMANQLRINAKYDSAQTTDEFKNYWANTDAFDADSAHSRGVRETLVRRSRYEITSNGISDGMAQTYANDLVGLGPSLRMQTGNKGFNRLVQITFFEWAEAIGLNEKLWTMAHAKDVDGEAYGILRRNPGVAHRIPLDVVLVETEQVQTPMPWVDLDGHLDGMDFDKYGNPTFYEVLKHHPGSNMGPWANLMDSEKIPARFVLHWLKVRRPGQHRGVPERASTLNLGAAFRRLREASLSTAEKIASWTLFLKTMAEPDEDDQQFTVPMTTLEIVHGMISALPNGCETQQLQAEQPGPNYNEFHKSLANEQGRPKSMPLNKILCNSADYNYASGRLDHQTYYGTLNVDRASGNRRVLDKIFPVWYDLAIRRYRWFGGNPEIVGPGARAHKWSWPKHQVADVEAQASADETRLQTGQIGFVDYCEENDIDPEDMVEANSSFFGVTPEEYKARLLDAIFPPPKVTDGRSAPDKGVMDAALKKLNRRGLLNVNGNGAHHG